MRGLFFSLLAGCATVRPIWDRDTVYKVPAERASLIQEVVRTNYFSLTAYSRIRDLDQPVSVYIEGDGRAWRSRTELSSDPTPLRPIALELASLDPLDAAPGLSRLPQRHFVGSRDEVVPPFIAESFVERLGNSSCAQLTEVPKVTHLDGWKEKWQELLDPPVPCSYFTGIPGDLTIYRDSW